MAAFEANGAATVVGTSSTAISITATSGAVTSNVAFLSALASLPRVCYTPTIDMKLLVVRTERPKPITRRSRRFYDYVGTPYDVLDNDSHDWVAITSAMLSNGACHGYDQGVIMATAVYVYAAWKCPL